MPLSDSFILTSRHQRGPVPPGSLIDLIYDKFDSFPEDKLAMMDDASGRRLSFRALKRLTGQVASGLAKRGFGRGHVLCLFGTNCLENAPVAHGAIAAGGTVYLVKPRASPDELRFHLALVAPRVIITTSGAPLETMLGAVRAAAIPAPDIYVIGGAAEGCRGAEELLEDPGDANPWGRVQIDPEDVAVMMLTGGTTGMSKTVPITHEAVKLSIVESSELMETTVMADQRALLHIPFSHVSSFMLYFGVWLRKGCTVVIRNGGGPEAMLGAIEQYGITHVAVTPAQLATMVISPALAKSDLSSLESLIVTGAALSKENEVRCFEKLRAAAPSVKMSQGYGMTELGGAATLFPSTPDVQFQPRRGSVGGLLSSFELRIMSCGVQRRPCKTREMGEILFRTPRALKGYFKNEEATKKALLDDWYCTGDYGYFDEDEYVYIVDRVEDLIKHKEGIVLPTHVEGVLRSHPGIKDCAVIGRSCEHNGEAVMACVVRQEGCDVTAEDVQSFAAAHLAPHECPVGGVRFVESIPWSPAGKSLRHLLRDRH